MIDSGSASIRSLDQTSRLSYGVQSTLSLAICIHLFLIVLAASAYVSPSELQARLKEVAAPYVQTFAFDFNHQYSGSPRLYLTHDLQPDFDFLVSIGPDLRTDDKPRVTFPRRDLSLAVRRRREQALAAAMGGLVGSEYNAELTLPIAQAVRGELGADAVTVWVRRYMPPTMADAGKTLGGRFDPHASQYYENAYSGHLVFDGTQYLLNQIGDPRDVSPVERKQ